MTKFAKNYYYGKNGEKKLNCYMINISKEVVKQANIEENDKVKIYSKDNKIIIEKEK